MNWRDPNGLGEGWPVPPDYAQPTEEEASAAWWAKEARIRKWEAFLWGTAFGTALGGLVAFASVAWGETIQIGRTLHINGESHGATTVTIEPSSEPGQLAVVTMDNALVNDAGDNGEYFIAIPGLAVGVSFTWDADGFSGSDQMVVTPPEGITCIPGDCTATVFEGMTGKVILLDWIGG